MTAWYDAYSFEPHLPQYCEPENEFLYRLSATFHTCVPTRLAFISTALGTCSIVAWLFAQLPQIWKNYQLKSTSGLSIFFLTEWLLGDMSNLFGSLFTRQALWQIIIAGYYCFVDLLLVCQWIWYEHLEHGRRLRRVWARRKERDDSDNASIASDILDSVSIASSSFDPPTPTNISDAKPIPSRARNIFHTPNFAPRSPSVNDFSSANNTPTSRTIVRPQLGSSPAPSPRTVLYISLLLAVLSTASPVQDHSSPFSPLGIHTLEMSQAAKEPSMSATEVAGKLLSWLSTLLYLGSRLPQLYKNHVRRSTSGLSPTLFAAAFFGNLFYSSSLLTNPCAWNTYPEGHPSTSRGWVGSEGSIREAWVMRAAPFFLGAAGVLVMDAMVGVQFWWFGSTDTLLKDNEREQIVVVVLPDEHGVVRKSNGHRWRWRRVSGWMRGWVPSVAAVGTLARRPPTPVEEQGLLVGGDGRSYGASGR